MTARQIMDEVAKEFGISDKLIQAGDIYARGNTTKVEREAVNKELSPEEVTLFRQVFRLQIQAAILEMHSGKDEMKERAQRN